MPQAHSYIRFSSMPQRKGASIRRQEELRDGWLARHPDVPLNKDLVAMGKSAFKGKHLTDVDGLKSFLDAIENKEVRRGDYLLIENLDRLSRQQVRTATKLFLSVLDAGVNIVTLDPEKEFKHDSQDMTDIIIAVVELSRAHAESVRKSDLITDSWKRKHEKFKQDGRPFTARIPAWLELVGAVREEGRHVNYEKAKYVLKYEAAKTVRLIHRLCREGMGLKLILNQLKDVPRIGRTPWNQSYVRRILKDRAVCGYRNGVKCYPAVVTEAQFQIAQQAMKDRKKGSGRPGVRTFNPFQGLLHDALDGCKMHTTTRGGRKVLISRYANEGRAPSKTFPLDAFEKALRGMFGQLDPHDLFDETSSRADEVAEEIAKVDALQAIVAQKLKDDPRQEWADMFTENAKRRAQLVKELDDEMRPPASASWDPKQKDPRKLNATLRRTVESIHCVVITRNGGSVCVAQVRFKHSTRVENYFIVWTQSRRGPHFHIPSHVDFKVYEQDPPIADFRDRKCAREFAEAYGRAFDLARNA